MTSNFYQPDKDAGWGLIFRLNALWEKADRRALSGNYDGWELVLDRIFANLLYRNEMIITFKDVEEKQVASVELSEQDMGEWMIMKSKIRRTKTELRLSAKKKNRFYHINANEKYYNSIFLYDIWVRKFMQRHQLYLKEIEHNPSKALFGGAFKKRRNSKEIV